jgi:hypothetical protein
MMKSNAGVRWVHRGFVFVITLVTVILTVTAIPSGDSSHLGDESLLLHMLASGVLVFALPLYGILFLSGVLDRSSTTTSHRWGHWLVLLCGWLTILTMLICMYPIASTDSMTTLMHWHGYAGFAMVPSVILWLYGMTRSRSLSR